MLNATAVCGPATFTAEFMLRSEWVDASAVAHQVIGCSIGGVICAWTLLILERIRRPSAFALAGGFTAFAGFFLAAWVVVLIKPEAQPQLWRFAQHDLVQIQHLAIASQLVLAGGSELLHAHALARALPTPPLLAGKWLHHLWFAHTAAVGLTFMLHPQVTAHPNLTLTLTLALALPLALTHALALTLAVAPTLALPLASGRGWRRRTTSAWASRSSSARTCSP